MTILDFERDMLQRLAGAQTVDPLLEVGDAGVIQVVGPFLDKLSKRLTSRALLDGASAETTLEALDKLKFNTSLEEQIAVRDLAAMLPKIKSAMQVGIYDRSELLDRATRGVNISQAPNGLFDRAIALGVEAYLEDLKHSGKPLSQQRRQRLEGLVGGEDSFFEINSFAINGHPYESNATHLFENLPKEAQTIPEPPQLPPRDPIYDESFQSSVYEVEVNGTIANNLVNITGNADLFEQLNSIPINQRVGTTYTFRASEEELKIPQIIALLSQATSQRNLPSKPKGLARADIKRVEPSKPDIQVRVSSICPEDSGSYISPEEVGDLRSTSSTSWGAPLANNPSEPTTTDKINDLYSDGLTEPFDTSEKLTWFDRASYRSAEFLKSNLTPRNLLAGLATLTLVATAGVILSGDRDYQPEQSAQAFYAEQGTKILAHATSLLPTVNLEDRLADGGLTNEDLLETIPTPEVTYQEPTVQVPEIKELILSNSTFTNIGESLLLTPEEKNSGLMVYTLAALTYGNALATMSQEELQESLAQTEISLRTLPIESRDYVRTLAEGIAEDNSGSVLNPNFTREGVQNPTNNLLDSSRALTITYDDILDPIEFMDEDTIGITVTGGRGVFSYLTTIASEKEQNPFSDLQDKLSQIDSSSVPYDSDEWNSATSMLSYLAESQPDKFINIPYDSEDKPDVSLAALSQPNAYAVRDGTTLELDLNTEASGATGALYQPNLEERIELAKFGSDLGLSNSEIAKNITYRNENIKPSTVASYLRSSSSQAMWQTLSAEGRGNYIRSRADEGASVQEINSEMGYTDSRARAVRNVLTSLTDTPEAAAYQETEEA
jgi:hypothetical protein